MSTGFVYMRPLSVVCAHEKGPYAQSGQAAWVRVFEWLDTSGMRRATGTGYGLLLDDPRKVGLENCRYEACVEVLEGYQDTVPAEFRHRRLPGGVYARQRHTGGPATLRETITQLRDEWAPARSVAIDPRRPIIEVYLDDPDVVVGHKQRIDICLPVIALANQGKSAA